MVWCVCAPYSVVTDRGPGAAGRRRTQGPQGPQAPRLRGPGAGKEFYVMELNYFKDCLFDLINECDSLKIADIEVQDRNDTITVTVEDGSVFEIKCRPIWETGVSGCGNGRRFYS